MGEACPKQNIIEIRPQPGPQTDFLQCPADVVFFGGSAGGGKSFALLLKPLYNFNNSKFGAVIFRRTTKQIQEEGALWDEATGLYTPLGAKSNENKLKFTFSTGMRVAFAHMQHEKDRFDWQGSQIPLIGFDEITHFTWKQFSYMYSRNRSASGVSGKILGTCNPDPDSWVRQFIDWYIGEDGFVIKSRSGVIRWFVLDGDQVVWGETRQELVDKYPMLIPSSFTFIRSSVFDNRILLEKDPAYLSKLHALPRVERAQLLEGNWNIRPSAGMFFRRSDFEIVSAIPAGGKRVRAWDLAGTKADPVEKKIREKADGPAWTVGVKMVKVGGIYFVEDIERSQIDSSKVLSTIKNTASQDGVKTKVRIPQDPGQAGKSQAKHFISEMAGYNIVSYPVSGSKETRATPLSAQAQAGNVKLLRGSWNESFLLEAENFPDGTKDQIDAASDAFDELTNVKVAGVWGSKPKVSIAQR